LSSSVVARTSQHRSPASLLVPALQPRSPCTAQAIPSPLRIRLRGVDLHTAHRARRRGTALPSCLAAGAGASLCFLRHRAIAFGAPSRWKTFSAIFFFEKPENPVYRWGPVFYLLTEIFIGFEFSSSKLTVIYLSYKK
jgi:hypothetical protein